MTENRTSSKLANSLRRAKNTAPKNDDKPATSTPKPPQKNINPETPPKNQLNMPSKRVWPD